MAKCIRCGAFIDTAKTQEIFFTVRIGEYECNKCHNVDINKDAIAEDNRILNPAEVFVIALTIIIIILIIYFGFVKA